MRRHRHLLLVIVKARDQRRHRGSHAVTAFVDLLHAGQERSALATAGQYFS